MTATGSRIQIKPLTRHIGAELVGIDLQNGLDDALPTLRAALLGYQVVIVRDQFLEPGRLRDVADVFGTVQTRPGRTTISTDGHADVLTVITPDGTASPDQFHFDGAFDEEPPAASLLSMVETPEVGGDLLCSSGAATYEALSGPMQSLVDELRVAYAFEGPDRPPRAAEHPLVLSHPETGRRCLRFDGVNAVRIIGLNPNESNALLTFLRSHVAEPTFVCRHWWHAGDFVMWDNRSTMHRAACDYSERRVIYRVSVVGDLAAARP